MISVFFRTSIIAIVVMAVGFLPPFTIAFPQGQECSVPERFYTFEPLLTKTPGESSTTRPKRYSRPGISSKKPAPRVSSKATISK